MGRRRRQIGEILRPRPALPRYFGTAYYARCGHGLTENTLSVCGETREAILADARKRAPEGTILVRLLVEQGFCWYATRGWIDNGVSMAR